MQNIALFATCCLLLLCYSPSTDADILHEKHIDSSLRPQMVQDELPLLFPETDESEIDQALSDEVQDPEPEEDDKEDGVPVNILRAIQIKLKREEKKSMYFTSEEVFSQEYGIDPQDEIRHLRKNLGALITPIPGYSGWNETFCGRQRQPWKGQEQIRRVRRNWKIFGVEEKRVDRPAENGMRNDEEIGTTKDGNDELLKRIPPVMIVGSSKDLEGIDQDKFLNNPSCQDITLVPSSIFPVPLKAAFKNKGITSAPPPLIVDLSSQSDLINKILSSLYSIRDIPPSKFRRLTYDCSFPIPEWAALICRIPELSFGLCNEENELPCKTYIKHIGSPDRKSKKNGPESICPINGATDGDKTSDRRTSGLVHVRWGKGCDVSYRFVDLPKADAVIFNADMFAELYAHQYKWIHPTNWTHILHPSIRRSQNQLWSIFMHGESATTYPYMEDPNFLNHFNFSSGHDRRFFQFHAPSYLASKRNAHLFTSTKKPKNHPLNPNYISYPSGPAPIVLFNSRCDLSYREEYVKELMKYIRVDIYGDCNNEGKNMEERPNVFKVEKVDDPNDWNNQTAKKRRKIIQGYRFNLVIENSICFDYVTEQFYDALQMDSTVPIYLGAPNIQDYSPVPTQGSHSPAYISALDFASPKELADHVYALLRDPIEYERYFQWKHGEDVFKESGLWREMEMLETSEGSSRCEICWRVKVSKCFAGSR